MIKLQKTPTLEQLMQLASSINDVMKDVKKEDMFIVFELDKDTIRQVDEEIFYKNKKSTEQDIIDQPDEVQINILGVQFKFITKNGNN